jgi:hypothetical protein
MCEPAPAALTPSDARTSVRLACSLAHAIWNTKTVKTPKDLTGHRFRPAQLHLMTAGNGSREGTGGIPRW